MAAMMRAITILKPGGPDVLRFSDVPLPTPRPCDVLIRIRATGVNRADLAQREGRYPPPAGVTEIPGLEFAGEVAESKHGWTRGERVMGILAGGGYAQFAAVHHSHLIPIPKEMPFETAGGVAEVWLTAFQLCKLVAKVEKGQNVLIHAAASGVGTSLIQLVREIGAVPIVTCGSDEKLQFCLNLGAESGCNYKKSDFSAWLNRRRADVIFDPVLGSYFSKNIAALKHGGHWVIYGTLGGGVIQEQQMGHLLVKRAKIEFTTLRSRDDEYKAKLVTKVREEKVAEKMTQGALKPIIYKVMQWKDVQSAHSILQSSANTGKVVLLVD